MKFGIKDNSMEHIINAIQSINNIDAAYLFGSRADGSFSNGSDVDIALTGEKIDYETVRKLKITLNERLPLPYFFDVVDLTHCKNELLREEIENNKVTIWERSV